MNAYIERWEQRCYSNGIPDTVPDKLLFSGRVPSYKAIAICILSNDLQLRRLGLQRIQSDRAMMICDQIKRSESDQLALF